MTTTCIDTDHINEFAERLRQQAETGNVPAIIDAWKNVLIRDGDYLPANFTDPERAYLHALARAIGIDTDKVELELLFSTIPLDHRYVFIGVTIRRVQLCLKMSRTLSEG